MHIRNAGFTLIEILIAVTILAIAAMVAVPMVSNSFDGIRVPTATRMVMSDILYAQNTAVTQQAKVMLLLFKDGRTIPSGNAATQAYTISTFPSGTPSLPTNLADCTTGSYSTNVQTQPGRGSKYCIQFGLGSTGENAPGALSRVWVKSVAAGGTALTLGTGSAFGFDSIGQPIRWNSTSGKFEPLSEPIELVIGSTASGGSTATLSIAPITGEITVQ